MLKHATHCGRHLTVRSLPVDGSRHVWLYSMDGGLLTSSTRSYDDAQLAVDDGMQAARRHAEALGGTPPPFVGATAAPTRSPVGRPRRPRRDGKPTGIPSDA